MSCTFFIKTMLLKNCMNHSDVYWDLSDCAFLNGSTAVFNIMGNTRHADVF